MTPDEATTEEKSSRSYWGFVLWPVVVVIMYAVSEGPALRCAENGIISWKTLSVYKPLHAALRATGLGRPFCWYLQQWCPYVILDNGEPRAVRVDT
jgi:hypothetical protein